MRQFRGVSVFSIIFFLLILAGCAYFFLPRVFGPSEKETRTKLKGDFSQLYNALENYRLDNGHYPSSEQGLNALIVEPNLLPRPKHWKPGGYISVLPQDPWGRAYQYINNYSVIRVYSYGPGGKDRGTEIDVSDVE